MGIGYEVLVVRIASQVLENTAYSFAAVLAVYLLGTAAGAALYQARLARLGTTPVLPGLLTLTSVLCLLGIVVLWAAEPLYQSIRGAGGGGVEAALLGEIAVAAAVLLLPTASVGATFSHLAQAAAASGFGLGRALALNTSGAALAPALFGAWLLPAAGSVNALVIGALGYAALSLVGGPGLAAAGLERSRLGTPGLAEELRALRLDTELEVLGAFLADAPAPAAFAGPGPVNTDDHPVVTYQAPRFAYGGPSPPAERLLALLDSFSPDPRSTLGFERVASLDATTRRRLHHYLLARDAFIRAGVGVAADADVRAVVKAVRGPLLEVVRTSRDVGAAYTPLLAMAYRLAAVDPGSAQDLLRDVESANPWRPEAAELRRRLLARP